MKKLIVELKQNLSRKEQNRQLEMAGNIWKFLMVNALEQISVSNSVRGFGALNEYYDQFVQFENVLFGVDPTYRDHTMHTLWVYFLGDYILSHRPFIRKRPVDWAIQLRDANDKGAVKHKHEIEDALNEYMDAVYCIIALAHDLAYPFEKVERVNKRLEGVVGYMGMQSFDRLQYSFSQEQNLLISEMLEFISQKAVIMTEEHGGSRVRFVKDNPTFVDMSQSFEQHKHGILSAYLLYRLVDTLGEATFTDVHLRSQSETRIIDLILRNAILYGIASHSCDYAYSEEFNNFRFLLSLVDELEEFSRYKRQGRDGVDEICKSGLEFNGPGRLSVEYRCQRQK